MAGERLRDWRSCALLVVAILFAGGNAAWGAVSFGAPSAVRKKVQQLKDKKGERQATVGNKFVLSANSQMLDSQTMQFFDQQVGDEYRFDSQASQVGSLQSGDIMLSNTGSGFLRKVQSVSLSGDQFVVQTDTATLEDAFETIQMQWAKDLTASEAETMSVRHSLRGVSLMARPAATIANAILVSLDDVVLYDADGDAGTTGDQIVANGQIEILPRLELEVDLSSRRLQRFRFVISPEVHSSLKIDSRLGVGIDVQTPIASYQFAPIAVGPLVLIPDLSLVVGVSANAGLTVQAQVVQTGSFSAGAQFLGGSWSPIGSVSNQFEFSPPVLGVSGDITGYTGPQLGLKLYGVVGPFINATGHLRMSAVASPEPAWILYGGVSAKGGVNAGILSWTIASFNSTLLEFEKELGSGIYGISPAEFSGIFSGGLTANWSSTLPAGTSYVAEISSQPFPNNLPGNRSSTTLNQFAAFDYLQPNTTYYAQVSTAATGPFASLGSTKTPEFLIPLPYSGDTPYNATVNAIVDHDMPIPYALGRNGIVVAYTGERGYLEHGEDSVHGYRQASLLPFRLSGQFNPNLEPEYLDYDGHPGIDFNIGTAVPVYAVADGRMESNGTLTSAEPCYASNSNPAMTDWGAVRVDHRNGYYTCYLHLSLIEVKRSGSLICDTAASCDGIEIKKGDQIGFPGGKIPGGSLGIHLHFEVNRGTIPVDPYGYQGDAILWEAAGQACDAANDGTEAAMELMESSVDGTICRPADQDFFQFTVSEQRVVSSSLTVPTGLDFDLELYTSSAMIKVAESVKPAGEKENITYLAAAGTYFLRVYGVKGAHNPSATYTLELSSGSGVPDNPPPDEPPPSEAGWTELTANGADGSPSRRHNHTGTWSNQENKLLVFGGEESAGHSNALWSYTTTEGWVEISVNGASDAPNAREGHVSVWDSNENRFLVFGGEESAGHSNALWSYTTTEGWVQLTEDGAVNAPSRRSGSVAVWDSQNNRLLVFGGDSSGSAMNDVWSYTTIDGWVELSANGAAGSPLGRYSSSAVWDSNENRLLVFGGSRPGGTRLNDLWSYTTIDGWIELSANGAEGSPARRSSHAAAWDSENKRLVLFGGGNLGWLNDLWSYTALDGWVELIEDGAVGSPPRRGEHAAAWDSESKRLLVFGGHDGNHLNDLWAFGALPP